MILRRIRILKPREYFSVILRTTFHFAQVSFFLQLIFMVHFLKNISSFKTNLGFCGVLKQAFNRVIFLGRVN